MFNKVHKFKYGTNNTGKGTDTAQCDSKTITAKLSNL